MEVARIQRRTLSLLFATQIVGGVGVAIGIAVGALLAAEMGGTGISGFAASAAVVGAALIAIPATRLIRQYGRRPGLVFAYSLGALGAVGVVAGAAWQSLTLVFAGMALFGGGTAANLQARYAAVDLAEPVRRGRHLSLVVWATTVGAVAGPNLAPFTDRTVHRWGLPEYAGPFAFSALAFGAAALAIAALMRPDPLLTARAVAAGDPAAGTEQVAAAVPAEAGASAPAGMSPSGSAGAPASGSAGAPASRSGGWSAAARAVSDSPAARLGVGAVAVGHLVMVGVMSMTPVHIGAYAHGDVLKVVGIVLSLHIAGMFAVSPLVGWLTDRLGRRTVILSGLATLLAACAVAGTSGHRTPQLSIGLALLGLGWSQTMVAGSTLLSESVTAAVRPAVQGMSDMVMGLSGALAGALSGLVVSLSGYPTLALMAAIATVPLVALALRPVPELVLSERN